MMELNPEVATWATTSKTNAILADIFDLLAMINANIVAVGSRKPAKKPKPYPRPGAKNPEDEMHFGKGALPSEELHRWIEEKRKQNAASSTGDDTGNTGT